MHASCPAFGQLCLCLLSGRGVVGSFVANFVALLVVVGGCCWLLALLVLLLFVRIMSESC